MFDRKSNSSAKTRSKIIIISDVNNPHVIRWVKILESKKYDVIIITNNTSKNSPHRVIECLSKKKNNYFSKIIHEFLRAWKIKEIIKKLQPNVIHIHSFDYIHPLMISLMVIFTKQFNNLIVSTWGSDVVENAAEKRSWRGKIAKKLLLHLSDEITATTKFLAEETRRMTFSNKLVHVIPFGIDCNLFSKKRFIKTNEKHKSDQIIIGFTKHLKPKYGPEYLLKAIALLSKELYNVKVFMVGDGYLKKDLKKLVQKLDIADKVEFPGYIQNENIPKFLNKIDIFAMPSIYDSETFGVAAIEAQAMEIPVVASKVGGVPEAIIDNETGLLVEPKNIEQLKNALLVLIKNEELRKKMGKSGRKFVLERFNINDNVLQIEKIYNKVINKNIN
jgi:glycosyltransferase involved in cell wall biosynthesis